MKTPKRFKKKLAPERTSDISSDELIYIDDDIMVTKFISENSEMGVKENLSYFDLKDGYSITEKFDKDGVFKYWYCDILEYEFNKEENSIIVTDLIADIIVFADQFVSIMDMDELADAFENKEMTQEQLLKCLRSIAKLDLARCKGKFPPARMKRYSKM